MGDTDPKNGEIARVLIEEFKEFHREHCAGVNSYIEAVEARMTNRIGKVEDDQKVIAPSVAKLETNMRTVLWFLGAVLLAVIGQIAIAIAK